MPGKRHLTQKKLIKLNSILIPKWISSWSVSFLGFMIRGVDRIDRLEIKQKRLQRIIQIPLEPFLLASSENSFS
jgi:hypothetical protein